MLRIRMDFIGLGSDLQENKLDPDPTVKKKKPVPDLTLEKEPGHKIKYKLYINIVLLLLSLNATRKDRFYRDYKS